MLQLPRSIRFFFTQLRADTVLQLLQCCRIFLQQAVRQVLKDGYRTGDIMSDGCEKVGTTRMGDLVAERIR